MITEVKNFVKQHPFLFSLIVATPFFFWHPLIAILILIIGLIFFAINKNKEKAEKRTLLIQFANTFMEEVKQKRALPTVYSSLMLEKDENAFFEEHSTFAEPRAVRRSTGSGVGFRVMKGVYMGGYSGRSESNQEWKLIDNGTLTLTNHRLIFRGTKENKMIPLNKILSITNTLESIEIAIDGKAKAVAFSVENSYIWASTIQIAKAAKNPLQLGDMKIEIEFK